jgi:transposase
MPRSSPYHLTLTDAERAELKTRARRYTSPYSEVIRAKIVLYAAEGLGNDDIAARLDTPRQVVSKWRKRFHDQRLSGLADLPRRGRPPSFSPEVVVAAKALACELPTTAGGPLARWYCPDLARTAIEQGIVASISGITIWRWLSADAITPWQHRSWIFPRDPHFAWIFPRDPHFAPKAARVLDRYARRFDEHPLAYLATHSGVRYDAMAIRGHFHRRRRYATLHPESVLPLRMMDREKSHYASQDRHFR